MLYPIPTYNPPNKDELCYWESFLTDDDINFLLSQPEWLNLQSSYVGNSNDNSQIDTNIRDSQINWLDVKPELFPIWKKLSDTVAHINSMYYQFDITGFHEPMQLSAYHAQNQGHYNWHTDFSFTSNRQVSRKISMAMLLSDPSEFEGGEFQVKTTSDEALTLECKKGRAWFFPSYVLHRVTPVTRGIRRSLVLWIGGPPFR